MINLKFFLAVSRRSMRDANFRQHALVELWHAVRDRLPARLVTRRRDYVWCARLGQKNIQAGAGRWLPPGSLAYRIGAYGLLFDEVGRLLLVSDPALNFGWNLPGGGVEKAETLVQGLEREFEEETGLRVRVGPAIANQDLFCIMPTGQAVHAILHFFLVEVSGGTFLAQGNGFDTSRVAFIDLDTEPPAEFTDYAALRYLTERARAITALGDQSANRA